MTQETAELRISDSALDPAASGKLVRFQARGKTYLYQVRVFLEGTKLAYVQKTDYYLHPTFTPQTRSVLRTATNPNCELIIMTWGLFEVKATVHFKDGTVMTLQPYTLKYDRDFDGARFVAI